MTIAPLAPAIAPILAALDAEQRAAALLPDGPALIIAPAGSGKTTTLVARLGVLVGRGVEPERIGVVTFNREAAAELSARIEVRLGTLPGAERIEVRTLHAMARQVLLDAGRLPELVADRGPPLRRARRQAGTGTDAGGAAAPDLQRLDGELSGWKVEAREPSEAARPALDAYQTLLAARGALDFDDLVAGAVRALERDRALRARWQPASRTCASTNSRTWTPPSYDWSTCSPLQSGTCGWSATTTSRSSCLAHTAGAIGASARWRPLLSALTPGSAPSATPSRVPLMPPTAQWRR